MRDTEWTAIEPDSIWIPGKGNYKVDGKKENSYIHTHDRHILGTIPLQYRNHAEFSRRNEIVNCPDVLSLELRGFLILGFPLTGKR